MPRYFHRTIIILALAAVMTCAACSGAGPAAGRAEATPTAIPTPMVASKPTYTVQRGDIVSKTTFSARVVPAREEPLFFRADGRVRTVYAKSGTLVTAGQVLADLVSLDELEKTRAQDELNLRRAEINLEMARLRQTMASTRTPTYVQNYSEQMALQAYEVELAQIALQEQQLRSSKVETAILDAQIIAPIDGRVLISRLQEGDAVQAFQTVMIVADDTNLEVGAKLPTTQMELLTEGMDCLLTITSRSGEDIACSIRQMPYPYGSAGDRTTTTSAGGSLSTTDVNTRISANMPPGTSLRMSDIVNVTVVLESKSGVLWLPPSAIRSFEGRNFVVVQTPNEAPRRVDIKTGLRNEDQVEVLEGLDEGQVVVAP